MVNSRFPHLSNVRNLFSGEFATSCYFPMHQSAFRKSVGNVVGLSSKKQMVRPDAARIVTSVKHKQAIRYWSNGQFIRQARCNDVFTTNVHCPVPFVVECACPKPAGSRFIHLAPKAFGDRSTRASQIATWAAKSVSPWPGIVRNARKRLATVLANEHAFWFVCFWWKEYRTTLRLLHRNWTFLCCVPLSLQSAAGTFYGY